MTTNQKTLISCLRDRPLPDFSSTPSLSVQKMRTSFRQMVAVTLLLVAWVLVPNGIAQLSGSRGGSYAANQQQSQVQFSTLTPETAQSFIVVEGKSVLSAQPTAVRIVLAITHEAETSKECKAGIESKIAELRPLWNKAGVDNEKIVEDFISILPRYEFEAKKLGSQEVAMEKKVGYSMQTNVHLAVKDDAEAMKVLDVAFTNGITDIIGFDYWSEELDRKKEEVRAKALQVAKRKSKMLFDGLFEKTPRVINVQENTVVVNPASMYESFTNTSTGDYQTNYWSRKNMPLVKLARPKNTYYRGNLPNADTQAEKLPMRAELSVVSTVRIYYESPAAEGFNAARAK